jgi:FemAB-related protein (PEP-CTERM system-associated)
MAKGYLAAAGTEPASEVGLSSGAAVGSGLGKAREASHMLPTVVRELTTQDFSRWDDFVTSCAEATFFHRAGWKTIIERGLGHRAIYLYAERAGKIEGILPIGHVCSRFLGNALISTPFCVYGGVAANSQSAREMLIEAACQRAEQEKVDHLELRNLYHQNGNWPSKDLYVTFRKRILPTPEENLKAIPRKQRAMVRKGIRAGLVSQVSDNVEHFYAVYSESVRNLGTPVLAKKYFRLIKEVFSEAAEVLTVTNDGRAVASVLSFYFRDQVLPYYGGGTAESRALKANDFMYWELMRRACERSVRVFDYGRSKIGTGSYHFKKNWGFEPQPLRYRYYLVRSRDIPDVNPLNPRFKTLIRVWQQMPLGLTRLLGPMIARNLG